MGKETKERKPSILKMAGIELARFICYAFMFFLIFSIGAPLFGKKVSVKGTVEKQAEKAGIALEDIGPIVYLEQCNPDIKGISYRDSLDLSKGPALIDWKEEELPFWLAVDSSLRNRNFKNPCIFLDFGGKVAVRRGDGWQELDPNYKYNVQIEKEIQPGKGFRLNPLFIKFPSEGSYVVRYSITGDDESPTQGTFVIEARKGIGLKKDIP